jgi:hypothetical protein
MLTRRDRIAQPWGARTAYGPGETWPSRDRGFYQSHQATAAAVQVNNVNIIWACSASRARVSCR